MIFFTELENLPTYDVRGEFLGRIQDLLVDPSHSLRVAAYVLRTTEKSTRCVPYGQMQSISVRAAQTSVPAEGIHACPFDEGLLRVKKDILDQQIIDVNLRKVVRVNDVDLDIHPVNGHTELRILAVNVGMAAAVRRLLQGIIAKHTIRTVSEIFPSRPIPWEFVNLIEPDPARRVKLRISYDRLAQLHPADIADILQNLSRDEQKAVIETLDKETAAEALAEIPTRMQAALLESIPPERAADIVEEMPPDEAADVLQQLPPETSAEVLADMEKEEASEVRGLLGFEEKTAGAMMTTDYIVLGEAATAEGAIVALEHYEGPLESVHQIFLVDSNRVLVGAVPVARLLLGGADRPLKELCADPPISVKSLEDERVVVDLFHKYNLLSLPVVDEQGHLLGVITADDVLELVINRR